MERKALPIYVKQIEDRVVKQIFSVMGNIDDGRDLMWPGAFSKTLAERADRVRVLWQHDVSAPPIGVALALREVGRLDLPQEVLARFPSASGALYGEIKYLDTPRGSEVLAGIVEGAIRENSIGYEPVAGKFDFETIEGAPVRNLREVKLWDVSPVNWGMNSAARNVKAALAYKDTGIADEGTDWAAPALADFTNGMWDELDEAEIKRIASHYAWSANDPAAAVGELKLPHHLPSKDGTGKAVWKGVQAAMAALMGARGGVNLPEGDRQDVYDHLAKHYDQFSQEPPAFKFVETCYQATKLVGLAEELKVGRQFSSANVEKIRTALEAMQQALGIMQEMMDTADPQNTGADGDEGVTDASNTGKGLVVPVLVLQQRARATGLMLRMAR